MTVALEPPAGVPWPGTGEATLAVAAPCEGPGCWAGAPSAALDAGATWLAYRVRAPEGRGSAVRLARSDDGERFATVLALPKDRFRAASLERPALVRAPDGTWRLYVSCATPGSKHWRIDVLAAARPEALAGAPPRTAFAGDAAWGVKDPVIHAGTDGWRAWICCHPLDVPGEEDRMVTRHATSRDGIAWTWQGVALAPRPGAWDARGARVTAVLPALGAAFYDGRATAGENFHERTGLALADGGAGQRLRASDAEPLALRYLDALALPGGGHRLFYERPGPGGAHALWTERIA
jgi:hypothetical protein